MARRVCKTFIDFKFKKFSGRGRRGLTKPSGEAPFSLKMVGWGTKAAAIADNSLMAEEGTATRCWRKFKAESASLRCSPFFVSFAAGSTLDPETWSRCISQDRHFLNAFAQAFKMEADRVENNEAIAQLRNFALQKIQKNEILVQASTIYTEDLLGKLSISLTNVEPDEMENLSRQALKLQVEFFAGQLISQKTAAPLSCALEFRIQKLTISSNFDSTCSVVHSIATLVEASSSRFQAVKTAWDYLSTQHVAEGKKYDYNGLHGALEQVAEVEKMAIARVEMLGILTNLTQQTIKQIYAVLVYQHSGLFVH